MVYRPAVLTLECAAEWPDACGTARCPPPGVPTAAGLGKAARDAGLLVRGPHWTATGTDQFQKTVARAKTRKPGLFLVWSSS